MIKSHNNNLVIGIQPCLTLKLGIKRNVYTYVVIFWFWLVTYIKNKIKPIFWEILIYREEFVGRMVSLCIVHKTKGWTDCVWWLVGGLRGLQPLSVTVLLRLSLYCLCCSVIVTTYCGARCPAEIILENNRILYFGRSWQNAAHCLCLRIVCIVNFKYINTVIFMKH